MKILWQYFSILISYSLFYFPLFYFILFFLIHISFFFSPLHTYPLFFFLISFFPLFPCHFLHTRALTFFSLFPYFVLFPSTSHSTPECSTHFKPLSHPSKSLHLSFFLFFFDSLKANDDEEDDDDDDDDEVSAYLHLFFHLFSLFPYFLFPSNRKQSST